LIKLKDILNEAPIDGDRQKITRAIEDMTKGRLTVGQIQIEIGRAIEQANISSTMKQNLKFAMQIKKESVNEDKFEASLADPKKYKMGTMWFKRWFKPKKEQDGWTWNDDGRYIWLTRPQMKHPTVRFEKDTGLLQGNWVDPKEMQW